MTETFDKEFLNNLIDKASESPRLRAHHLVSTHADKVQRVICAVKKGSYFPVHKHPQTNKWELVTVLSGHFQFLTFDNDGCLNERIDFRPDRCPLIQAPPNQWHTFIAMEDSVFMEVKEGPFNPEDKIEFAEWSPSEGDESVPAFIEQLFRLEPGQKV